MSSRTPPRMGYVILTCAAVLVVLSSSRPASAWIENHVLGDDVRVELDRSGKAVVEHRLTLKTNGSVRLHDYRIEGISRDAVPLPNSYAIPASDALSGSLASATPVTLEVVQPKVDDDAGAALVLSIGDRKGLRRGTYVFVLRYRADLMARGRIERDGALVRVTWNGPIFEDGFDNARTTIVVPAAPTAPRAVSDTQELDVEEQGATLPATYFSEVRRGGEQDEIELVRTYAHQRESAIWAIRIDARALDVTARQEITPPETPAFSAMSASLASRDVQLSVGAGLFALVLALAWCRAREVLRLSREANAETPPLVPMPGWLRAVFAAGLFLAGCGLQLLWVRPVAGAFCVVGACAFAAHGASHPAISRRGPGRWLSVTEREAFGQVVPLRGARLDASTRVGKLLLLGLLACWAGAVYWFALRSLSLAMLAAFDAVILLAIFGTGRLSGFPPDMAVEPARFLRKLVVALRKKLGMEGARLVARVRIPRGELDPDELRLMVVPRLPLRGFVAIEVGMTYALGFGARVGMPEVLLRVVGESPCDEAVARVSRSGRITPGRKPDERVIAFAPRLPTVAMTAEIVAALAVRVIDREARVKKAEHATQGDSARPSAAEPEHTAGTPTPPPGAQRRQRGARAA